MNKILIFSASWCGPCKAYKEAVKDILSSPNIICYDIDEYKELTQTYKIQAVPTTIVLDENGTEINRFLGPQTSSKLRELLNE